MDDVTIARAIHVLAVIHWMGGVAFVRDWFYARALADPGGAFRLVQALHWVLLAAGAATAAAGVLGAHGVLG